MMEKESKDITTLVDNEFLQIDLENGILIGTWKDSFVDLTIAEKVVSARLKAAGEKKYPFLIKIKSIKNSTKEARDFLASKKGCEGITAGAFYVDSVLEKMLASFFIFLNKPIVPTKIFNDENKAIEWLEQFARQKK